MRQQNQIAKMKIDRFEDNKAILFSDGKECILDKKMLPKEAKEGDFITLSICTEEAYQDIKQMRAKEILNEILNNPKTIK